MFLDDGNPPPPHGVAHLAGYHLSSVSWVLLGALTSFLPVLLTSVLAARQDRKKETQLSENRRTLEARTVSEPANAKLTWDLGRATIETYFYQNVRQVNLIFSTAIGVMGIGFLLIIYGCWMALQNTAQTDLSSKLTVLSGVVTQFISVTFMVLYRSTLNQATSYMSVLEKINAVGMAVQIADTIPPDNPLYAETRATMAKQLLGQFNGEPKV